MFNVLKFIIGKIEVNLSLYLLNYAACREDLSGSDVTAPLFLNFQLDGDQW